MGVVNFAFALAQGLKPPQESYRHIYPPDSGATDAAVRGTLPSSWLGGAAVKGSLGTTRRVSKQWSQGRRLSRQPNRAPSGSLPRNSVEQGSSKC